MYMISWVRCDVLFSNIFENIEGPAHGGRRGGCILVCKAACAMYILENILEYESAWDPLYSERYSRIIRRTQWVHPMSDVRPAQAESMRERIRLRAGRLHLPFVLPYSATARQPAMNGLRGYMYVVRVTDSFSA